MTSADHIPSPSEQLCLACGMCCDGTLHYWTRLDPHEVSRAEKAGLRVFTRRPTVTQLIRYPGTPTRQPAFHQPCSAFQDMRCAIYSQRPQACRVYACRLLESLERDEITLDHALALASRARTLIQQLVEQLPGYLPEVPLAIQVRLNWPPGTEMNESAREVLAALADVLREGWKVRWRNPAS